MKGRITHGKSFKIDLPQEQGPLATLSGSSITSPGFLYLYLGEIPAFFPGSRFCGKVQPRAMWCFFSKDWLHQLFAPGHTLSPSQTRIARLPSTWKHMSNFLEFENNTNTLKTTQTQMQFNHTLLACLLACFSDCGKHPWAKAP